MKIAALDRTNSSDWFDFFDNRAFADHQDWKGCYCTSPFTPRLNEYSRSSGRRRDYAEWLIETSRLRGYLAYEDGKVVGWCNVNLRGTLPMYALGPRSDKGVLSIACFMVEKEYRRRGIATKLLRRVIQDATKEGVAVIEAYPRKRAVTEFGHFLGPFSMYERQGFREEIVNGRAVMRRYLDR